LFWLFADRLARQAVISSVARFLLVVWTITRNIGDVALARIISFGLVDTRWYPTARTRMATVGM